MIRPTLLAIGSLGFFVAPVVIRRSHIPAHPAVPLHARKSANTNAAKTIPLGGTSINSCCIMAPTKGSELTLSALVGDNVDVSNECAAQSETFIALNPGRPDQLTAGSNEIFRLPQRAFFSSDDGGSWGGVDVPLPVSPFGRNDQRFASDPTLAYDTQGHVYYGFIVVFLSPAFTAIKGTELAVARSSDGGQSWPLVTEFSTQGGQNHFNDKPMITVDQNTGSPFRDRVYIAWDAASGGSPSGRRSGRVLERLRTELPRGPRGRLSRTGHWNRCRSVRRTGWRACTSPGTTTPTT